MQNDLHVSAEWFDADPIRSRTRCRKLLGQRWLR
jgi:hypothetical protein